MGNFYSVLKSLRTANGLTQEELAKALKISRSTVGMYENGSREPDYETLEAIADFFNVDIDYLLGRTNKTTKIIYPQTTFTQKDEKDIAKRLEETLEELENSQSALMFSGEPLDSETRELLKASLENSIRIAKINAKQKFTPKKYRNNE